MAGIRLQVGRAGVVVSLALALCWSNESQAQATVTINPSEDNTIADGVDPGTSEDFRDNSSGACEYIFSGTTNDGFARRALLRFDVAGNIPAGSTINSVTLTMTVNRSGDNQDATMTLHPVSQLWGEGTATCGPRGGGQGDPAGAGDATWLDAEFGSVSWSDPGGDFGSVGTEADVGSGNGNEGVWSSAVMVIDVQGWLDNPQTNFGWILVGDEARAPTSRRFSSREGAAPPTLTIDFTPTGNVFACCFDDGSCSVQLEPDCAAQGGTPDLDTQSCEPNPCPQPTGACCNLDESCSDNVDRLACESAGGFFQGANNTCNQGNIDCGLTPFVDPLPIPPPLPPIGQRADGVLQYTVEVVAAKQQLHSELPDTDLWTYNGAYPSFTIETMAGEPIEVTYINNLPTARGQRGSHLLDVDECPHGPNYYADSARISTHVHGAHVPARFDGQPELTILPGEIDVYQYPNNQDAATMWYHDHALGITRLNVYSGMAGFYLLRDADDTGDTNNAFGLPSGEFEIPIVIQDREFNDDGSLFYNPTIQNAFKGNRIVVNGKVWPFLNVKRGIYRFRMLNGSQAREYSLRMENLADPDQVIPFTLIGTDLGLITAPIPMDTIAIMAPAERMDVIVDFSSFDPGTEIVLRNDELTTPLIPNVMKFVVTDEAGFTGNLPTTLRAVDDTLTEGTEGARRYFWLTKLDKPCSNEPSRIIGEWLIESLDGPQPVFDDDGNLTNATGKQWDDISEFPTLGSREIWEFQNPTNSMHPMHVHLVKFQVLDKFDLNTEQPIPLEPWEDTTWKDTVRVPPKSKVRVIMDFEDYLGKFPYHCHILDHEDHEMMRQFQTVNDPANCVVNGICDPGEDCDGCADCAQVSGALCGNGLCEAGDGENCVTCPDDCAGKQKGSASRQFCCGYDDGQVTNPVKPLPCGDVNDDRCIDASANLFCRVEPRVMACCGDALCEGQETVSSCAVDCVPCTLTESFEMSCFDGLDNDCDVLTDEADPDCQTPCVPTEEPDEVSCFDGIDNDCDDAVDCADLADCEDVPGAPTTCGVGICESQGNLTCSNGIEVDTCTPGAPNVEGLSVIGSCTDDLDNDCDGLTDANDPDCQQAMQCSDYPDRQSCRDAGCKWKQNMCQNP